MTELRQNSPTIGIQMMMLLMNLRLVQYSYQMGFRAKYRIIRDARHLPYFLRNARLKSPKYRGITVNVSESRNVPVLYVEPFSRLPGPFRVRPKFYILRIRGKRHNFKYILHLIVFKFVPTSPTSSYTLDPFPIPLYHHNLHSSRILFSFTHNGLRRVNRPGQGRVDRQQDPREAERYPALLQIRPRRRRLLFRHPRSPHTRRCVSCTLSRADCDKRSRSARAHCVPQRTAC
jgi:hypothetical protein